jgi:hypothetical protein
MGENLLSQYRAIEWDQNMFVHKNLRNVFVTSRMFSIKHFSPAAQKVLPQITKKPLPVVVICLRSLACKH